MCNIKQIMSDRWNSK